MKKALFISERTDDVYSPQDQAGVAGLVDVYGQTMTAEQAAADRSVLRGLQVLMTTWRGPVLDEAFLRAAPGLEAVFFAAGSVKPIVTDAFWQHDAVICSAWQANAIPVAEFTLAQVLLGLKQTHQAGSDYRQQRRRAYTHQQISGAYGGKVGIISLGMIGRLVIEYLNPFNVEVLVYDPFVSEAQAESLGVQRVDLDELFQSCDVVSLHAPLLEQTQGMIRGRHFEAMRPNTTFINTARGAVVNETELIEVLERRSDLCAVLDVTWPEPPDQDSPLWSLTNVVLTPHLAGSVGKECFRMGRYMLEELHRYVDGQPLNLRLTRQQVRHMA